MRKGVVILLLALFLSFSIFAEEQSTIGDIVYSDIPISYGEAQFRERILERTNGERDPIGLVLTGGSARAFAHLGVLKYLEEEGVEPDYIVSNSMGSIIGMLYAAGLSSDQILSVITSGELSTFFKMTAPLNGGILEPTGFKGLIQSVVGTDFNIEDLAIPVMVICQDLVTKREIRICEGNFADILVSSFALPAYFPPQEYKGHLLIDGGIITLAPISVAYEFSDTVIASTTFYDNEDLNLKNMLTIINGAFDIGKRRNAAIDIREYGDKMIWIRCGVEQFSFMEFSAAAEMAEIGYESAKEHEAEIKALYHNGLSDEILYNRGVFDERINKIIKNQYYFSRIEQSEPTQTLSLGVYSFQGNDYPYYLRDYFDVGLEYSWKYKFIELSALLGGAFNVTANKHQSSSPLLSIGANIYPINSLRLSLYGAFTFDNPKQWYIPSLYLREGVDWKFYSNDIISLQFNQAFEMYNEVEKGSNKDQNLLSCRLQSTIYTDICNINLHLGYLVSMYKLDSFQRHYGQVGASTRIYFIPNQNFYLDIGTLTRFALDGRNGVQIYAVDGFLTNNTDIMETSRYDDEVEKGINQKYMIVVPLSIGYAFTKSPTFGELLMAEYLELSAYCDFLFYNGKTPGINAGVELQFLLSLIGLQKFPLTLRVGYDSLMQDYIFSIRFAITK